MRSAILVRRAEGIKASKIRSKITFPKSQRWGFVSLEEFHTAIEAAAPVKSLEEKLARSMRIAVSRCLDLQDLRRKWVALGYPSMRQAKQWIGAMNWDVGLIRIDSKSPTFTEWRPFWTWISIRTLVGGGLSSFAEIQKMNKLELLPELGLFFMLILPLAFLCSAWLWFWLQVFYSAGVWFALVKSWCGPYHFWSWLGHFCCAAWSSDSWFFDVLFLTGVEDEIEHQALKQKLCAFWMHVECMLNHVDIDSLQT